MGKQTIIMVLAFIIIAGVLFSITGRKQFVASVEVADTHHSLQARQLANSRVKKAINILTENLNHNIANPDNRRNLDTGFPTVFATLQIDEDDEFYIIRATATIEGISYESEVKLCYVLGDDGLPVPVPNGTPLVTLAGNRINFKAMQPNFNSGNIGHAGNILRSSSDLDEEGTVLVGGHQIRLVNERNNVINEPLIIYTTKNLFLHGTFLANPDVDVYIITTGRFVAGQANSGTAVPLLGAVIGSNINLIALGQHIDCNDNRCCPTNPNSLNNHTPNLSMLRTEHNSAQIRIRDVTSGTDRNITLADIGTSIPPDILDQINPGNDNDALSGEVGGIISWQSRSTGRE